MYENPALILGSTLLYGLLHSALAAGVIKSAALRILGSKAARLYRFFYNILAGLALLLVLFLIVTLPDQELYRITMPWVAVTIPMQAAAMICMTISFFQTNPFTFLGIDWLLGRPVITRNHLVTSGFYQWIRHPLYTFGIIILWLNPFMSANILAFSIGLTIYILVGMKWEEQRMITEFGDEYINYQRTTPSLIPGVFLPFFDRPSKLPMR